MKLFTIRTLTETNQNEKPPKLVVNLTLYGRTTILKSLAISKLVYNTFFQTFPAKFIAMVNQAITQFVLNKKAKIKYRTMIGPKELGGQNMLHARFSNNQ